MGDGNTIDPPNPNLPLTVVEAATTITQGTTAEAVIKATKQVLAQGGIMVGEENAPEIAAVAPAASWFVDPVLAFNLAIEAHQRKVSGRFTVTELGQMWADMSGQFNLRLSELAQQWDVRLPVAEEMAKLVMPHLLKFTIVIEDASGHGGWTVFNWFEQVQFICEDKKLANQSVIEVRFHPLVKKYLLELTKQHTFSLYELLALT